MKQMDSPGQKTFILVATHYFSKWIKVESYANIEDSDIVTFVWKNIVIRFGLPEFISRKL